MKDWLTWVKRLVSLWLYLYRGGLNKETNGGNPVKGGSDSNKALSKKEAKKSKQQAIDIGVIDAKKGEDKEHNDSFEKYYNKDLDLDEG